MTTNKSMQFPWGALYVVISRACLPERCTMTGPNFSNPFDFFSESANFRGSHLTPYNHRPKQKLSAQTSKYP